MRGIILAASLCCLAAWAQTDRPNLSGTWHLSPEKSKLVESSANMVWQIDEKDDSITFKQVETESGGHQREVSFTCGINGKDCPFKESDGKASASFWYNGPVLVEMKTSGHNDHVSKYRLKLTGDSNLEVEVLPILPANGKQELLVFTKQ